MIKIEKKLRKIYLTFYNLLIAQCKLGHDTTNCETCRIKHKYCNSFLEYTNFKNDLIEYKWLCCNKSYQRKFDKNLKERFCNTYKFSNHKNNKFVLFLQKGVYPHEYMNDWENSMKHHYQKKKIFIVT